MTNRVKLKGFKELLLKIDETPSITGKAQYHLIAVDGANVKFKRNDNIKYEYIPIQQLYDFYTGISDISDIKTTTAKKYITGRVQSPATAMLRKIVEGAQSG